MKMQLNSKKVLGAAQSWLYRLRHLLVILPIIGLIGYAAFLAKQTIALEPDQAYLTAQRQDLDKSKIVFDKKTIETINNLQQVNPKIDLTNIGKSDPFSP